MGAIYSNWINRLRHDFILIFVVAAASMLLTVAIVKARTYVVTEDARAIQLAAGCELWDIHPPSQPKRTIVLACPKTDGIRLWPMTILLRSTSPDLT
jgi:hypothetical protein